MNSRSFAGIGTALKSLFSVGAPRLQSLVKWLIERNRFPKAYLQFKLYP